MIPKRAATALVTTVLGLVLLLNFKTPEDVAVGSSGQASAVGSATSNGTTSTPNRPTTTGDAATPAPDPATTEPSGQYRDGTATGSAVTTRFGDIQVEVTISNGAIVDVAAVRLPDGDRHSARISSAAEPLLREAALEAQSAQIDLLSGATYTSTAYRESLQSALDQLAG